jgi:hypothetical protein
MDGDGDLDVLSADGNADKIAWYENLSNPPARKVGDSNGDGIFNSSDLIVVFQAGEYEDGVPQNSTFEEGDWNGDHEFDSSDLVLAFQAGTYVPAARPAARADIGSALVIDVGRGLQGINHARMTQRTSERSSQWQSQPLAAARRWDVAHVDRVFAEHAGTAVRGIDATANGTILDAMSKRRFLIREKLFRPRLRIFLVDRG